MCGIAGVVTSEAGAIDTDRLMLMTAMLNHRGPDDRGVHVEPRAGLGHARLSIVDLAGGRQPMSNGDGSLWITFNGEIFNHVELREELVGKGHRFRTESDTEVILHLFEEEGAAAVEKLNGQWAFGIWNSRSHTLFLSRDRVGVRPLFYTAVGGRLLFASEIKALFVDPDVSRKLDPCGLDNVFTFWTTLPPRTAFKSIRALPPGSSLWWRNGTTTTSQHWRPTFARADSDSPREQSPEALRHVLDDAIRLRMRADVPVGAYLSGGLDSSVIVALMQRRNARLRTFSIAFDDPGLDESLHQREVVRALQLDHVEMRCQSEDISRVFPDVVWHAEAPLLRTAPAPLFLLSQITRDSGYKVVLTGEGADEVLGGYDIFKEAKIRRFWSKFPASTRRASLVGRLYPYLPNLHRQPTEYLRAFFHTTPEDLASPWFSHLPRWRLTSRLKALFSPDIRAAVADYDGFADIAASLPAEYSDWPEFSQTQYLETAHLLPGYLLSSQGDRVAMAHSIECRHPFLDPRLMAFASRLPASLKMKVLNEKYLLKHVARDLVPASVGQRSKQPYRAPDGRAFFGSRRDDYVGDLLSTSQVKRDGIFRPEAVSALVNKFHHGKAIGAKDDMALVGILSTQLLVDRFINHFETVNPWNVSFKNFAHS
jgi:asparagine synthase (glutamine-hydrolysing)